MDIKQEDYERPTKEQMEEIKKLERARDDRWLQQVQEMVGSAIVMAMGAFVLGLARASEAPIWLQILIIAVSLALPCYFIGKYTIEIIRSIRGH